MRLQDRRSRRPGAPGWRPKGPSLLVTPDAASWPR